VVNLSNIEKVYTDDPRKNPNAQPLDTISWADFRAMVGDEWQPGKNCPFDPIASKKAAELGLTGICASGKNIENTRAILEGGAYIGTTIR
ncbi:MAG: UMP kinase, partial [Treponemataceae bacterium]|nr:UMP kinase [Treponemataceae bacterium]